MSRQPIISRNPINFSLILALLYAAMLSSFAQAEQTGDDFEIQYHEPLDFRIESASDQGSGSPAKSAKPGSYGNPEMLSFDAFGKRFELVLEPNDRLIANLPVEQQEALKRGLKLYGGKVSGIPNSWVRITVEGDRISGMIWDGAEMYVIDNASNVSKALGVNEDSKPSYPLIYRLSDTTSGDSSCALDPAERPLNDYSGLVKELNDIGLAQATSQLDVAIVADTQFIRNNANTDAAVVARINVVDGIFSEQVGVRINIAEIRSLRNNNSLSSTNASTLLRQLSNFVDSAGFNNPGLTHLFTGRDLDGSTIGIAFLGTLCNRRRGVGISQTRGNGTAGALTVAHELGHNFGAPHDNQSGSACARTPGNFIMNPFLNGTDQFSQCSVSQMQPNIRNAACLTGINPNPPVPPAPVPPAPAPLADIRVAFPVNPINATIDQVFDYRIEVRNSGAAAGANAFSEISIPNQLDVQSSQVAGGSCTNNNSGTINCDLNRINASAVKTVTIRLRATQTGRFISTVNVGADNEGNTSNNQGELAIDVRDATNNGLFVANFDTNTEGFVFVDDAFRGTDQPDFASGRFTSRAFSGGGLRVLLGGRDNADILGMSGGFERSFNLDRPGNVTLSLRFRLRQASNYEADEFSDGLVSIDGRLIGRNRSDNLARIRGNGNGGPIQSTGWQLVTLPLGSLSTGTHTLTLGAFNNKKTLRNEATEIIFDDVELTQ